MNPNIFNYATSELSQDAVICYFAAWGHPKYKDINYGIEYTIGNVFISCLLDKCLPNRDMGDEIKAVEVKKQYNNIDVLILIETAAEKYALIIEDKTHTSQHSNQLARYKELVESIFKDYKVYGIYFKTGNQSDFSNDYTIFLRKDIIEFTIRCTKAFIELFGANSTLKNSHIPESNTIYKEFKESILAYEEVVNSWQELSVEKWKRASWEGFFMELTQKNIGKTWNIVPGSKGQQVYCLLYSDKSKNYRIYLHIKSYKKLFLELKINFKDIKSDSEKKEIFEFWQDHAKKWNIAPQNYKLSKKVTVFRLEQKDWLGADGAKVDLDTVVKNLEKYKDLLKKTI